MPKVASTLVLLVALTFSINISYAQWSPGGSLLDVPVTQSCSITEGRVATARPDGLFLCARRADVINAQIPDASHFYVVHEYGLLAIRNNSKRLADCWAAHQLGRARNGPYYIRQWMAHWRNYGSTLPSYGTPEQRIANVRACCACGM